jgi:hypothetical protein
MRLTGLGKFVILILALGFAAGAYRNWQEQLKKDGRLADGPDGIATSATPRAARTAQQSPVEAQTPAAAPTEAESSANSNTPGENPAVAGEVEIPFVITAAKKDWVGRQVDRFNAAQTGRYRIVTRPVPSREAMHAILEGKEKPVLWSPGSPIWPARLSQAWQQKNNSAILDLNNPNGYRVFLRTPLVFLTTRSKAAFLRPLLSTPQCWENLRKLSTGRIRTPFGPLSFSHADPLTSSSGMLTLGLILYDYGQRTNSGGDLAALARSPKFMSYVAEVERGLVYDVPAEKGTTALTKAFLEDTNRYDVITAYESTALAAAVTQPEIAVIYPSPTAVSEHAVSLLSGDWVSPQQKAGAEAFISFLGEPESLRDGVKSQFRPAGSFTSADLSLTPQLSAHSAQGFQQSFVPIEMPPYDALNTAAYQWRVKIAKQAP